MSTEITIIKQENIATIVQSAPQSFADNRLSHDRCLSVGQSLLDTINASGMTDELDQQAASFIEKARRTVKVMNERRSPVTKMFDEIRSQFTVLETGIDPAKAGTVPYQLQQLRNQFAARKREEEQRRQREAIERQRIETARRNYTAAVEDDLKREFKRFTDGVIGNISRLAEQVTLDNYEQTIQTLKDTSCKLPEDTLMSLRSGISTMQYGITSQDAATIETMVRDNLAPLFREQYDIELRQNLEYHLDRLPSRRAELERIKQANADEAARLKAEAEQRQAAEAARLAEERAKREEEERQQAALRKQNEQMQSLFDGQVAAQTYQPKAKVTKRIQLLNPEGILPIISMWWTMEGCHLSTDELAKMFKKQITYCEKLANKGGEVVQDESVQYVDEVKAK